jgi:hypothetical protein
MSRLSERTTQEVLDDHLPGPRLVAGRMAFLEWTVDSGPFRVPDGADSYLIEDGKIQARTIHDTLTDPTGRVLIRADGTRSA